MIKPFVFGMTLGLMCLAAPVTNAVASTLQESVDEINRALPALQPITWTAPAEKVKVVVFIDNQCVYCTYVVKNVKKYNDAGITMSFLTVAPESIKDEVISDMARVWCSADRQKSLSKAMAGFLPDNDSTPACMKLVKDQSALADRMEIELMPTMVVMSSPPAVVLGSVKPEIILQSVR